MVFKKTYTPAETEGFRIKERMSLEQSLVNAVFSYEQTLINNGIAGEEKSRRLKTPMELIEEVKALADDLTKHAATDPLKPAPLFEGRSASETVSPASRAIQAEAQRRRTQ